MSNDVGTLELHPLSFLEEHGEVVIGRRDIDSFGVFPPDGAELVRRLHDGKPLAEAATWYEATYGESVDVDDLVETLRELDFVRSGGPTAPEVPSEPAGARFARALFSLPAACAGLVLLALAGWCMAREPWLRPSRDHVFVDGHMTLSLLAVVIGQIPGLLVHEGFHALAGRRLGLPTKTRLGRRLIFLVVETRIHGLVAVPRRQRYLPYLAGMIADVLWFAVLTIAAAVVTGVHGPRTVAAAVLLSLAVMTLVRLGWQFYLHLRTDVYIACTDLLRCTDLHEVTKATLRWWTGRLLGRPGPAPGSGGGRLAVGERDLRVARWYAVPFLLGCAWSITFTVLWLIPVLMTFTTACVDGLTDGTPSVATVLDSGLALLLCFTQFALVAWLAVRNRWARRAAPSATSS
jgi:hypothetical protein